MLGEMKPGGVGESVAVLLRHALKADGTYEPRIETIQGEEPGATARAGEGDQTTYRIWVLPLRRAHHEGECVILIRDVSQQMRADRAREEFVTQVTHELRTPLTNIRAYAETLSQRYVRRSEGRHRLLQRHHEGNPAPVTTRGGYP